MLRKLTLRDFRNFSSLDLEVPPQGLVITGDNGHGKTNLLEAIACLGLMRSFRGARDAEMVRFGSPALHIRAELGDSARWHAVSLGYDRALKRKVASLDGVEQPRLSMALGALPSVVFSPSDVSLVAGGPSERRRFLDVMLALSSSDYLQALQTYRAALLRRNAVLRMGTQSGPRRHEFVDQAVVWEPQLAESGGIIAAARRRFAEENDERYTALCEAIGERGVARLRYSGEVQDFSQSFDRQRENELRRGVTLVGPHRDDLVLSLDGRDLRPFGSAGQQRSAAIALRLLELGAFKAAHGDAPLLLLDDPFAELDLGRAARVLDLLDDAGAAQAVLVVPRIEDIPGAYTRLERRSIRDGVIT